MGLEVHRSNLVLVDLGESIDFSIDSGQEFSSGGSGGVTSLSISGFFGLGDLSLDTGFLLSHFTENGAVWVQFGHGCSISKWIWLGSLGSLNLSLLVDEDALDGIGVDESVQISISADFVLQSVSRLAAGTGLVATEVGFQRAESRFGPDAESTDMTTWGELSDVQSVDVAHIDSWNVSEGSSQVVATVIDDEKWASSDLMSSVSHFTLTTSKALVDHNSLDISPKSEGLQKGNSFLGLRDLADGVVEDQWNLVHFLNSVTSGHNQWSAGGGSNGGGKSVSSLVKIDLSVPSSPGVQWMGHTSLSAHITEGGLTGSVSTGTGNSWNTGNGSSGTPGFSGVLHTGLVVDTVSLFGVSVELSVNETDDIVSDWGHENMWHLNLRVNLIWVGVAEHGNGWSC